MSHRKKGTFICVAWPVYHENETAESLNMHMVHCGCDTEYQTGKIVCSYFTFQAGVLCTNKAVS